MKERRNTSSEVQEPVAGGSNPNQALKRNVFTLDKYQNFSASLSQIIEESTSGDDRCLLALANMIKTMVTLSHRMRASAKELLVGAQKSLEMNHPDTESESDPTEECEKDQEKWTKRKMQTSKSAEDTQVSSTQRHETKRPRVDQSNNQYSHHYKFLAMNLPNSFLSRIRFLIAVRARVQVQLRPGTPLQAT